MKINNKPYNTPIHLFHLSRLSILDKIKLWHKRLGHFYIDPIKTNLLKIDIKAKYPICSNLKLKEFPI